MTCRAEQSQSRPLRVLAIHRYYWPDAPPYATLLRAIVERWHEDGHRVYVLSSQPSYKPESALERRPRVEVIDHATVCRIPMRPDRSGRLQRLFNTVWFPVVMAGRILLGRRYDHVMCSTAPPVLLGAAVSATARLRRAQFIYHCMDLHPEIGALTGEFSHPLVYRVMERLELATCRRASAIIVLSGDMRDALLRRDADLADRIVVLNNFELPDYDASNSGLSPLSADSQRLRIAFTGNIGRFQGLEAITEAILADDARLDGVELVFMGEGAAKKSLEALTASAPSERRGRVVFLPHGSPSSARALLRTADVGLVSLIPNVIRYAYPSKTATYLSEGLPLLVAVELDTELADLVISEGIGLHLPVDNEAVLMQRFLALIEHRDELPEMARRAHKVWERKFSADVLLQRWSELLAESSQGGRT